MKIRFRHRLEYAALRAAIFVVDLMPEGFAYRGVAAAGRLFFRASKRRQRIALRTLKNAFPDRDERELLELGRVATGNLFKVVLDMLRLDKWLVDGNLQERIDDEEALTIVPPAPYVGLTAHLGSWEVLAAWGATQGGGADVIVQTIKNPLIHAFFVRSRARAGLRLHPRRGGIRGLARALREGRIGLQAVDQNQRLRGVFVPFFGEIASTERAAATLALRQGLTILIGACLRTGVGFRFRIDLLPTIKVEKTAATDAEIEALVCEINRHIEELVLRYPDQYLWIHDRYRTRPPAAE